LHALKRKHLIAGLDYIDGAVGGYFDAQTKEAGGMCGSRSGSFDRAEPFSAGQEQDGPVGKKATVSIADDGAVKGGQIDKNLPINPNDRVAGEPLANGAVRSRPSDAMKLLRLSHKFSESIR
jgi:hypothetical protein